MSALPTFTRRIFLQHLGKTSFAIAVLGLSACSPAGDTVDSKAPEPDASGPQPAPAPTQTTITSMTSMTPAEASSAQEAISYHRVNLGFVSAYILMRSGEAAIVDTGVEGSAPDIEAGLASVGMGWTDVGHLILTHRHPDHVGSADVVLSSATSAAPYAGAADIGQIRSPRAIVPVGDGDEVFGLQIIETPGHTDGHISVLDPVGGVLVVGDALNGANSSVIGPNPEFSSDMETANESVRKLAGLSFDTVLFGHGEPVAVGAGALVAKLASEL